MILTQTQDIVLGINTERMHILAQRKEATGGKRRKGTRREASLEDESISTVTLDGRRHLATLNMIRGNTVYGERLLLKKGYEYRIWDPFRSKLAAALTKGLKEFRITARSNVLYLGASTGTTVSHISDIVGQGGRIFAVESSSRVARELIFNVASKRHNVTPIIADARKPRSYFSIFDIIDFVYCDIAQPDQTQIAIENCKVYLKPGGTLLLVIKTRSIDVTMEPRRVIKQEVKKLEESSFIVEQRVDLDPFDKDHAMVHAIYTTN